jgi:hypothetical protein
METPPVKQGGFVGVDRVLILMLEIRRLVQSAGLITLKMVTELFA